MMKAIKIALGSAVLAFGIFGVSKAFAYDATRCSGKGCLDIPISQPVSFSETNDTGESSSQTIYSAEELQLSIDANGYPVMETQGQYF